MLNKVGQIPLEELFGELESMVNGELSELVKTPAEALEAATLNLSNTVEELDATLRNFVNVSQGKPSLPKASKNVAVGEPADQVAAFKSIDLLRNRARLRTLDAVSKTDNEHLKTRMFSKSVKNGIEDGVANLVDAESLVRFNRAAKEYAENLVKMADASETDLVGLQKRNDELDAVMQSVAESLKRRTTDIIRAGEAFANDTKQSFSNALSRLLKGESDEDKNVFETFAYNLLDDLTSQFIDTLSRSFSDELLSDIGLDKLGAMASSLGNTLGGGEPVLDAGEGMFDGLVDGFGKFTDGLPDIFENTLTSIGDLFGGLGETLLNVFSNLGRMLASMVGGGGSGSSFDLVGSLFKIGGALVGGFESVGSSVAADAAANISTGFEAAATSMFDDIWAGVGAYAGGGRVSGPGTPTSDSIFAMLSNEEFVVNAKATKRWLPLLTAINEGKMPHFAIGGSVGSTSNVSPTRIGNSTIVNLNITGDISRQTKAEIYAMLPTIANGVNAHNREMGI
jgi:hypothetical protein